MTTKQAVLHYSAASILFILALPVVFLLIRNNYTVFHSLVDGTSTIIASCAFTLVWTARRSVDNNYFLVAGISFLFFAILNLLHLLGNKGMNVFPEYGNLGPAFYIAGRYLLSISMFIAPWFINRRLNIALMFTAYSAVTAFLILSILYWRIFPATIVEGVGLTLFKVISDYIICLILLGAIVMLRIHRHSFDDHVLAKIVSSLVLSVASGLTFTLYTDPFGVTNMLGHFFQIASFYLLYRAFIETIVRKPQEILFRKLKQNEENLTINLQQLDRANSELRQEMAERRRAEAELLQSEAKYRYLFENITEEVHFWRIVRSEDGGIATWRLVDANPPALKSWGRATVEDIKDKSTDEIFGVGATEHYLPIVEKIMREGNPHSFEDYFPQLDMHFQFTSVPLGDYFITTGKDITALKKNEEDLRLALAKAEQGDRLLSALMEHVPEGIAMVDADLNVMRVSRYGEEMLGKEQTAMITAGKSGTSDTYHADGETPMNYDDLPLVRAVREGEIVKDTEIVQLTAYGGRVPLLCNAGPIRDAGGKAVGGILAWRDMTEHKQVEDALRQSNRDLQQFAYAASHDLQEPLRAITGFLQLLQARFGDDIDEKGRHYMERTIKAGQRMQQMIRDLLNLTRVGNDAPAYVSVDLNHLIHDILDNLRVTILEKQAEVVHADLPLIQADPGQMCSLFQNLILNGLKYNESSRPRIEIGSTVQGNFHRIFIKDNGIGIAPQFHERIFNIFQRLHASSEYAGTGMGLALCKKIVERHGGTIRVESRAGEGATFHICLPRGR